MVLSAGGVAVRIGELLLRGSIGSLRLSWQCGWCGMELMKAQGDVHGTYKTSAARKVPKESGFNLSGVSCVAPMRSLSGAKRGSSRISLHS